ncbi:LUD domain-containing protein, partial [Candidatus Uhrbacteria bacterium]|nr:LUD domain-containing protein [Candidatus Uhrbacteria bacterium]
MKLNQQFGQLASSDRIDKVVTALAKNGIKAMVVENGEAAKQKILELIPAGAEVMNMSSQTLETISVAQEINESGRYDSARNKLKAMDEKTQAKEKQQLGAAPEWVIGSVHAVTEDGTVLVASATGSQLPAYAYGSRQVIWLVGSQKLVKDFEEGMRRLHEYTFPLEDE